MWTIATSFVFVPATCTLEAVISALQWNISFGKVACAPPAAPSHLKNACGVYSLSSTVVTTGYHTMTCQPPHDFYILNESGTPTPIQCIHPQDGLEVVGITQSLLGDLSPALQALQKKADAWQEVLKSNFLPRSLLWHTLTQVLWSLLHYSLEVTTFSLLQVAQVVSWLYQTLLP